MQVHTPLMAEHSIIRRMMEAVRKWTEQVRGSGQGFEGHAGGVIDFLCMYVDRCHHVKEEEILFPWLEKKKIHESDRNLMEKLTGDHAFIMRTTGELMTQMKAGQRWDGEIIERKLGTLSGFYLEHIRKEEEDFFPRVHWYFSYHEQNSILQEFWRFNEKVCLEKYHAALHKMEALTGMASYPSIRLFQSG